MRARITQAVLRKMPRPTPGKKARITDTDVRGFVAMKTSTGAVSFHVEYGPRGQQKRRKLADLPETKALWSDSIEEARGKAKAWLGKWAEGTDPDIKRRRQREMPTWKAWVPEYLEGVVARKKRAEEDVRYLKGTDKGGDSPAWKRWGGRPLDSITARDIDLLMREIKTDSGKISANRWWASVSACFAASVRVGVLEANPAAQVKMFPENPPRDRVLSDAEWKRFREAVAALESTEERALFTVLTETGCRRSEALRARWEDIDFAERCWRIPATKSGKPQLQPLPLAAIDALRSLDRYSEFVFPGRDPAKPRRDIRKLWARLKTSAKLEDINVHDIRRTRCKRAVERVGLHTASRLMRHSKIEVTQRVYNPQQFSELLEAADAVSDEKAAEVVPIGNTRKRG